MISIRFILRVLYPLLLILLFIALIFIQLKLSKAKEKIFGLFIPIISFFIFLPLVIHYIIFKRIEGLNNLFTTTAYLNIAFPFISTVVNFIIYYFCRKSKEINLEKMNIQDLN